MNIKTLSLGLLTTLATVTTPALAGYQVEGFHIMDGSDFGKYESVATPIIDTLVELGVPVLDGNKNNVKACAPREDGSRILGFYSPSDNFMVVCTGDVPMWLQLETLVHESVHVIQDARDGIDNDTMVGPTDGQMEYLSKNLSEDKITNIVAIYDQEDWALEAEAFFFEEYPKAVGNELKKFVF